MVGRAEQPNAKVCGSDPALVRPRAAHTPPMRFVLLVALAAARDSDFDRALNSSRRAERWQDLSTIMTSPWDDGFAAVHTVVAALSQSLLKAASRRSRRRATATRRGRNLLSATRDAACAKRSSRSSALHGHRRDRGIPRRASSSPLQQSLRSTTDLRMRGGTRICKINRRSSGPVLATCATRPLPCLSARRILEGPCSATFPLIRSSRSTRASTAPRQRRPGRTRRGVMCRGRLPSSTLMGMMVC